MIATLTAEDCARRFSRVLRREFQWTKCADKWIARRIDVDQRTAQNYLYGAHCPPAHKLIELMAECSGLADEVNRLVAERRAAQSELRLGFITLWWCRASVSNELGRYRAALAEAANELKPR